MFCPNCGRANLASDNFCRYCGKRLTEEAAQETPTPAPESVQEPEPQFITSEPDFSTQPSDTDFSAEEPEGARKAGPSFAPPISPVPPAASLDLRRILNAPVVLAALIACSAALGFNLLGLSDISYVFSDFMYDAEELTVFFPFSILSSLLFMLPQALIIAGSWMTYANAKTGQTKTSGLTLVKVALIIQLVLLCVMLGIFELIFIIATAMLFNYDAFASSLDLEPLELEDIAMPIMQGVFVFLILFVAAVIVLAILYYVKALKTVDTIRGTILTGVPSDRVSGFVAVLQCIGGGLIALSAFNLLLFSGIFSALSSACSATAYICFGVFLFEYRSKMRALMADPGRM